MFYWLKKIFSSAWTWIALAAVVLAGVLISVFQSRRNPIDDKTVDKMLDNLGYNIDELEKERADIEQEISEQIESIDSEISDTNDKIETAKKKKTMAELDELQKKLDV